MTIPTVERVTIVAQDNSPRGIKQVLLHDLDGNVIANLPVMRVGLDWKATDVGVVALCVGTHRVKFEGSE